MKLLLLDMNEMESEEAVHNYLMEKLAFPDYYGKNLDALPAPDVPACPPGSPASVQGRSQTVKIWPEKMGSAILQKI